MKKVLLTTSLFLGLFSVAQETATCPVTGKTMSISKENPHGGPHASEVNSTNSGVKTTPATVGTTSVDRNKQWWPNQLNLNV